MIAVGTALAVRRGDGSGGELGQGRPSYACASRIRRSASSTADDEWLVGDIFKRG